jgi:hypothetical protein
LSVKNLVVFAALLQSARYQGMIIDMVSTSVNSPGKG